MGMGIAGLMTGAGAGQGLEALLKQRLMEREMALREQQAQAQQQQHAAELQMRGQENAATREANDWYRQMMAGQRQQGLDQSNAENLVQSTPVGGSVSAPDANLMQRGGQGGVLRTIPMTGMTTEGGPAPPIRFRGYTPQESMRREDQATASAEKATAREDQQTFQDEQRTESEKGRAALAAAVRSNIKPSAPQLRARAIKGKDVLDTWYPDDNTWGSDKGQTAVDAPRTTDERNRGVFIGRMSNVLDHVDKVSAHINTLIGAGANVAGVSKRALAAVNEDPAVRAYLSQLDAYAVVVGRALGDNRISDFDVPRYRAMFPTPEDDKRVRDFKILTLTAIFNSDSPETAKTAFEEGRRAVGIKDTSAPSGGAKPGDMKTTPHGTFSFDGTGWVKVGGQ